MHQFEAHVTRDLVQARVLGAIFSKSLRGQIALKGGLAMRVMASSVRYTDDIDLAASPTLPKKTVESCVLKALADIQSAGVLSDVKISDKTKQSDTTQKWKITGRIGSHEMSLKIEVSRRQRLDASDVCQARYEPMPGSGIAPVLIACVGLPAMAAGKFDCLLNPKREAPRDIYDLYLLVKMEVRPSPAIIEAYGRERLLEARRMIWDKMEKMDYAQAKEHLIGFLPVEAASRLTSETWDEMRLEVEYKVSEWIDAALAGSAGDPVHIGEDNEPLEKISA